MLHTYDTLTPNTLIPKATSSQAFLLKVGSQIHTMHTKKHRQVYPQGLLCFAKLLLLGVQRRHKEGAEVAGRILVAERVAGRSAGVHLWKGEGDRNSDEKV